MEIGKADILKGSSLPMKPLLENVHFIGIDVDRVFTGPHTKEASPCAQVFIS